MKKVCEVISQKAFNCIQNVIDTANYYICTNVTVRHCDDGKSVDSNTSLQESAPSPAKVDEEFKLFVVSLFSCPLKFIKNGTEFVRELEIATFQTKQFVY